MAGDPGRIKRALNEYVGRRLLPVVEEVEDLRAALDAATARIGHLEQRLEELAARLEAVHGTVTMAARRRPRPDRIRVLFLVHYMEAWDSIADVVEIMRKADDFDVVVASVPRRLPGSDRFCDEELTHRRLTVLGIPHLRLDDSALALDTVQQIDPHLIFRQSQWDPDLPPSLSTQNLGFARLALIPYEVFNPIENVVLPGPVHDTATDSRYHRNCWAVFCANDMVKDRAAAMSPATGAEQYVVTGHPKVARLRAALAAAPTQPDRPFTVMWSAHHSIDGNWTGFGLFPTMWPQMVQWARDRPDWRFVFSPHPSLLAVMDAPMAPLTQEAVDDFWAQWGGLPNTEFDPGGQDGTYGALFARVDVCVSDGISMLIEFQIANKPVVHLAREGHAAFNDLGQVCSQGWHTVASVDEVRGLVQRFADGELDALAGVQREVVSRVFGDHDAAQEIVDYIRDNWDSR